MFQSLIKSSTPSTIRFSFLVLGIFVGIVQAVRYRYSLSSEDIISYLDIADAYLKGDWTSAINGNWSPLYSWLFALAFWIFKPSGAWEFPLVKLVNFLIFIFAFASFNFFLHEFILYAGRLSVRNFRSSLQIPEWIWLCLGYILFLFSSLIWLGIYCDTPDMSTVGLIYIASGLTLRITYRPEGWLSFIALGIVLAFSYFSKAAMFPLSFVFFIVILLSAGTWRKILPRTLVAFLVFLLVVSPYVGALSMKKGKLTFSETGKLSYIWFVYPTWNVISDQVWQGKPPEFGTPQNPIRQIFDHPPVFEFGEPIGGTFPLWTDPSYWYEGISPQFNLKAILRVLILNLLFYYKAFLGILVFGYLALLLGSTRTQESLYSLAASWQLLLPAIAALGTYALATDFHANTMEHQLPLRFIAAFIVLLFAGVYATIRLPNLRAIKPVIASLTIATVVAVGIHLLAPTLKQASEILTEKQENINWQIATEMKQLGVQAGDKIAIFGSEIDHVFWARLAHTKIIVKLEKPEEFWANDWTLRTAILEAVKAAGANAVVQRGNPLQKNDIQQWKLLGNTGYYAYLLKPQKNR